MIRNEDLQQLRESVWLSPSTGDVRWQSHLNISEDRIKRTGRWPTVYTLKGHELQGGWDGVLPTAAVVQVEAGWESRLGDDDEDWTLHRTKSDAQSDLLRRIGIRPGYAAASGQAPTSTAFRWNARSPGRLACRSGAVTVVHSWQRECTCRLRFGGTQDNRQGETP